MGKYLQLKGDMVMVTEYLDLIYKMGEFEVRWSDLPDWANYVTIDWYGHMAITEREPHADYMIWIAGIGKHMIIHKFGRKFSGWKDLIFERPWKKLEGSCE
jgi:hypothetical protein